jgi:diguanylate cyclase (GGDEF)-like protein|tara:strand:+ start:125977 stop:127341 length:1365 start_codon:yes stop_codon:yes gene_type:complete
VQGHDVTDAHLLAREVSFQAAHDPLTGLYNRREFARLTQALVNPPVGYGAHESTVNVNQPHALLYLDLDQFKIVNDRCGHAAGDELLRQVAGLLNQQVRDTDILARMGGDEFAIVLRHCDARKAQQQAERLRVAVNDLVFVWNKQRYGISISIGLVALDGMTGTQFNEALSMADAACFLAKEKGRNRVQLYHPSDAELIQQQRDMDWAVQLKDCMEQNRVKLYAQRIVCLQADGDRTIDRCEILARLLGPDGQLVLPSVFIPAAERYGLMPVLDRHIINKAFNHLHNLPAEQRGKTLYFINISGVTLGDESLAGDIERMMSALPGFDPRTVCFEITETAALSNLGASQLAMQRLIDLGFQFALDDFGSGMSSFAYLRKLPVHYLKIDGEFIAHIHDDPVSRVMVESMVKVARTMEISTVGEFVESAALADALTELGINYAQGYGLHMPEPLENL